MIISRLKYTIPFVMLFLLFSILGHELYSAGPDNISSSMTGERLPSFNLPSISSNKNLSSSSLKGRVTLLNIWASWCPACRAGHAMLMRIKNEYRIPIYGILYRDNTGDAVQYLNRKGNPYVVVGDDSRGNTAVDLGIYGTPETYVISPQGRIVYRHVGVVNERVWTNTIYPLIKQYEN